MVSITRILWPTDFSALARRALPIANELAERFGASLDVLHVVADPPAMAAMGGAHAAVGLTEHWETVTRESREALEDLVAREVPEGIQRRATVLQGQPAHTIIDYVREHEIDLVVLATHGETGLSRLVFGSVAEKIVRLADCLVLTVPPPPDEDN